MSKFFCYQFVVLILSGTSVFSQSTNIQLSEKYVDSIRVEYGLPGISTVIAINDSISFQAASGFADIDLEVKASPKTVYPIASVSKVFTTTAMMSLVSSGIMDLDTPIKSYIDYPISDVLSIRHLATHTSGVRHYYFRENINAYEQYDDLSSAVQIFWDDSLLFPTGTGFNYSSYGMNLIGFVMEKLTDKSFDALVSERILRPLDMKNTFMRFPKDSIATSYNSENEPILIPNLRFNVAGGGMYSNATDLVQFGQAILNHTILDEGISQAVFTNATLTDGTIIEYGIGWIVKELTDGTKVYYHDGHLEGAHSLLLLVPELNLSIAMLSNKGSRFGVMEGLEVSLHIHNWQKRLHGVT